MNTEIGCFAFWITIVKSNCLFPKKCLVVRKIHKINNWTVITSTIYARGNCNFHWRWINYVTKICVYRVVRRTKVKEWVKFCHQINVCFSSVCIQTINCFIQTRTDAGAYTGGGSGRNLRPNWAQGEENYTLKGEEFIQFLFTKSETIHSCRFETKMRQNAQNPISISFFFPGNTPDPRHWGLCPRPPGEGREGGKGGKGEGRERGREGGSLRHCHWGDRRPWSIRRPDHRIRMTIQILLISCCVASHIS